MNSLYRGKQLIFRPRSDDKNTPTWTVEINGLDMGGKMTLHDVTGKTVAIKIAGHNYSVDRGGTEYVPAHFILFSTTEPVILDKQRRTQGTIESFVHEFPVKRQ